MKTIQFILACTLLLVQLNSHATTAKTDNIIDSIKPFDSCLPASTHAQQALKQITELLDYQGEAITLCRSTTIPTMAAWSKLLRMEKHPYVSWKKRPITTPHISYNPNYLRQLEGARGEVIAQALLARQVGHHIKKHTDYQTPLAGLAPTPAQETTTDYFVGVLLARLGLSGEQLAQAQDALFNLAKQPEEGILQQRQEQLMRGWIEGGGEPTILPEIALTSRW